VLYLVQGARASSLPPEYEVFSRPGTGRHFMFSAFKEDTAKSTFFPRSNIGEARNMLYLMAREQEARQGWLYNYIVMLDDDIEFEVNGRWLHGLGKGITEELGSSNMLDASLRGFEQWLSEEQPALGALCWNTRGCLPQWTNHSIGHVDHKIVAYHREALETLLPMPTHRDTTCWWASQWVQTLEVSLYYRGFMRYYTGALRLRNTNGVGGYELHAKYPKRCQPSITVFNVSNGEEVAKNQFEKKHFAWADSGEVHLLVNFRDVFATVYHDLRAMATRVWTNGDTQCFDQLVTHFADQGALDMPARAKGDRVYYWEPGRAHKRSGALGLDGVYRQPCTAAGPWAPGSENVTHPFVLPAGGVSPKRLYPLWGGRLSFHNHMDRKPSPTTTDWRQRVPIPLFLHRKRAFNFARMSKQAMWEAATYRCPVDQIC